MVYNKQPSLFRRFSIIAIFLVFFGACLMSVLTRTSSAGIITSAQLNDYTSSVKVTNGDFEYRGKQGLVKSKLKIHKIKHSSIDGSMVIVIENLTKSVTLLNADGYTDGAPYIYIPDGFPNKSAVKVPLTFSNPDRAKITFSATVHQLINGSVNAEAARALTQPFTIAAIPDTQVYVEESDPAVAIGFQKQVEWVLANYVSKNIAFVAHLGDVVDNGTDLVQWANAMAALNPLLTQDNLPFSIVRGNHDEPGYFLNYLEPSITQSKPWFVDAAPGNLSQAQVFRVEGACILHIGFQKDPTTDELVWANALLARPELQGLPVIVTTHDYIDGSGQSSTGKYIWNDFVKDNPMVFIMLNGHTHTEYALVNHNAVNRPVYQMLSDYQDRANAGNGLMRLVTIDPVQNKIQVKTFSPWFDKGANTNFFETDEDSQFEYTVNVKERLAFDTTWDFGPEPPAPPLPPLKPIVYNYATMTPIPYTHVFQNRRPLVGTTTPYTGTVDVQINENNATLNYGGEATLTTDMDDNGSRVHAFLRFDDIVGNGPGQIPPGSKIISANLVFNATSSTKGKVIIHRMLLPWGEHSTWMDFTPTPVSWTSITYLNTDTGIHRYQTLPSVMVGGGLQADGIEAAIEADFVFTMPKPIPTPFVLTTYGTKYQPPAWDPNTGAPITKPPAETLSTTTAGLTTTVQGWVDGTAANYGWFFEPTSSDGWDFETAEGKQPPTLVVIVEGFPLAQ
jgi:predicted phosphodiesterase